MMKKELKLYKNCCDSMSELFENFFSIMKTYEVPEKNCYIDVDKNFVYRIREVQSGGLPLEKYLQLRQSEKLKEPQAIFEVNLDELLK